MRIGFDAKRAYFNNTGLGNYSRDTIQLLSYIYPNNEYFLYTPEKVNNKRLSFLNKNQNITTVTPNYFIDKIFTSYWRSYKLTKSLKKDKLTIFHGLSNEIPLGIENTNIKSIVTIHDLIFIRYPKLFNLIDRKIYYKKFKSSCERADLIIAISHQTKQDITKFFSIDERKIKVIYQGCNQLFQKILYKNDLEIVLKKYKLPKKFLLYVGTIEERKNLLNLLKAVNEIKSINLVIIGNGNKYKEKCLNYIKKNKLSSKIFFLKNIPIVDMPAIYQAAEIMIYPSIFEGFGIPIIESLFSKTPVITSKGGCFEEAGGANTKYVNPLSVDEIKNAINEILHNMNLKKEMISNGYQHAQKFTDDIISKNLMKVYKSIL